MPVIALEEHYATPGVLNVTKLDLSWLPGRPDLRLCDVSAGRVADMDEAGIDMQVLSLATLGVQGLEPCLAVPLARACNTELREAIIAGRPERFAGFATLPACAPEEAAAELERSVKELGLVGAMINGRTKGRFLDHPSFDPILACAAELDVPIYLHPEHPTPQVFRDYYAGFGTQVSGILGTAALGWHQETALHAVRLVLSGAFDNYPGLKIILGHLGEGLPFYFPRFQEFLTPLAKHLKLPVTEYFRRNFWITTSGFADDAVFGLAREMFGSDRLMFSVDYPFSDNKRATRWFDALPLDPESREQIGWRTAAGLLRL